MQIIISEIIGGLGNQMFQYAVGRALSLTNNSKFLLDLRRFKYYSLHNGFEIDRIFSAPVAVASKKEISSLIGWRDNYIARKFYKNISLNNFFESNLKIEPTFGYWDGIKNSNKSLYLSGYWQSEKYFKEFENTLRKDFSFQIPLDNENSEIASRIGVSQAVAIHVRRGDYLTDVRTSKIMSVCNVEYYHKAIKYITELVENPEFYIFSDDIEWTQNNLKIPFPAYYITNNYGAKCYVDMQLMSLCKHQIIANSTFSWWAAWLNANKNKKVVAPNSWFRKSLNTRDLIPINWIRL